MHGVFDQFKPTPILGALTDASIVAVVVFLIISALSILAMHARPGKLQVLLELLHNAIAERLGPAKHYTPLMMSIFLYIAIANLLGTIPGVFPITSHLSVTFGLSITVFLVCLCTGLFVNTRQFIAHFIIPGAPKVMSPFLAILEAFLYLLRPITLGVRLGINMTVGHIVISVLAQVCTAMGMGGAVVFPFMIFVALLEFAVCLMQAAIFTLLSCMYIREVCHHH
jgi:F-type H+-transporting ATPase subunit a